MILELGCYQIRTADPGLSIYKHSAGGRIVSRGRYKGQTTKDAWYPIGKFPHDYAHALRLIADDYAQNKVGKKLVREGLEDVANYVRDIATSAVILEERVVEHDSRS